LSYTAGVENGLNAIEVAGCKPVFSRSIRFLAEGCPSQCGWNGLDRAGFRPDQGFFFGAAFGAAIGAAFAGAFLTGHLCFLVGLQTVFLATFFGAALAGAVVVAAAAGAVVVVAAAGAAVVVAAALPRTGIEKARATERPRADRRDFFMASFPFFVLVRF